MSILLLLAAASVTACDPSVSETTIDQVEDRAFAAMKAASQAVADAARKGEVGSAGDADWATYKRLRGEAETLRLRQVQDVAKCNGQSSAAAEGPVAASPPFYAVETRPSHPIEPPSETSQPTKHFLLHLDGGLSDYHVHTPPSSLGLSLQTDAGVYTRDIGTVPYSLTPTPPPVPNPIYPGGSASSYTTTMQPTKAVLGTQGWANDEGLGLSFAPDGFDRPGFRFDASLNVEDAVIKSYLKSVDPTPTGVQVGAPTAPQFNVFCQPLLGCSGDDFYVQAPFTYQYLSGLTSAGPISVANKLIAYNSREEITSIRPRLTAEYSQPAQTPIGKLDLSAGVELGANWYEIKRDDTLTYIGGNAIECTGDCLFTTATETERRASGPGFRASIKLAVSGPVWSDWPLRWRAFGTEGVELVDLTVQLPADSTALSQTKNVATYGLGLDYSITDSATVSFDVIQRKDFYLSDVVGGQGQSLSDGTSVDLRTALSTLYAFNLGYRF